MAADAIFEVLDELIDDENTLVTYKSLSRDHGIHVNEAKSLLHKYAVKRGVENVSVIYCVIGTKEHDDQSQSHHVCLVPAARLDDTRVTFTKVTSCHVYSLHKTKLKDSNALYIADFDKVKENISASNRYSAVQHPSAVYRSSDVTNQKSTVIQPKKQEPEKKPAAVKEKPNLFSQINKSQGQKSQSKSVDPKKRDKGKQKQDGLNFTASEKTSNKSPPSVDSSKGKKTPRNDDDSGDEVRTAKRRKVKVIDSSSDEDEDDAPDSPIPSPPPPPERAITPDQEPRVSASAPDQESGVSTSSRVEESGATPGSGDSPSKTAAPDVVNNNGVQKKKRRVRKRKQVPKTYMDAEGFMVTEKVWESDSTDASDTEPVKVAPPPPKPKNPPTRSDKGKGKKTTSAAGGKKQASLMNFFAKK